MRRLSLYAAVASVFLATGHADEFTDLLARAGALVEENEHEAALVVTREAVTHAPDAPSGHALLARLLVTLGDFEGALDAAARALELAPEPESVPYLELYVYAEAELRFATLCEGAAAAFAEGRFPPAGEAYEDAWRLFPEREQAAIWAVIAYSRGERVRACARVLQGLRASTLPTTQSLVAELSVELEPLLAIVYEEATAEAEEEMAAKSWSRAELLLQDATLAAPERFEPRLSRAICLAGLGEIERALDELEIALATGIPDPRLILDDLRLRPLLKSERLPALLRAAFGSSYAIDEILANARASFAARPLFGVLVDGQYGLIDGTGELVVEPRYDRVGTFAESRIAVGEGGVFGFVSGAGEVVVPPRYASAAPFSQGVARVRTPAGFGFVDAAGEVVLACEHEWVNSFSEGLCAVARDGKWGFLDRAGAVHVPLRYERVQSFREGRACVRAEGRWGVVDLTGATVVPPRFDAVGAAYADGLLAVLVDRLWGFVDLEGSVAIEPRFQACGSFAEGLAPVRERDSWGFVDRAGATRIAPRFEAARPFSEGRAAVRVDGRWGFVGREGELVIEPKFDDVRDFRHGAAWVEVDGYEGWVRPDGNLLWAPSE